jgi:hypothetical protein
MLVERGTAAARKRAVARVAMKERKERKPQGPQSPMQIINPKTGEAETVLGRDIQTKIGQQLRAMYDDVLGQGVPDRFTELLRRLDERGDKDPQ